MFLELKSDISRECHESPLYTQFISDFYLTPWKDRNMEVARESHDDFHSLPMTPNHINLIRI